MTGLVIFVVVSIVILATLPVFLVSPVLGVWIMVGTGIAGLCLILVALALGAT